MLPWIKLKVNPVSILDLWDKLEDEKCTNLTVALDVSINFDQKIAPLEKFAFLVQINI